MGALVFALCLIQRFDNWSIVWWKYLSCSSFFFLTCSYIDIWFFQGKFVAKAMSVIAANTDAPISVKCRIGVDDYDSYNELCKVLSYMFFLLLSYVYFLAHLNLILLLVPSGDFIYKVSSLSPTRHFIIHSRKALLNGISPAENRTIPPLK